VQAERGGRLVLVDLDGDTASVARLPVALATDEPQLALRGGMILVPRLARVAPRDAASPLPALDPEGTVLLTGATGGLGRLMARHLAVEHGVRHLLLASRRGAAGADGLAAELRELGAEVTFAACDVGDAAALAELVAGVPPEHPLTAVVHAAGVNDDALASSMTHQQMETVLRPKADAAFHLHQLTRELDLAAFVLFSSASGTFGGPGQANYAAANAFLDALAQRRVAEGLPALSLAWGLWSEAGGMGGRLTAADLRRMARNGMGALSAAEGLALFDTALRAGEAAVVPAQFEFAALRTETATGGGSVPALFRGLIRTPARVTAKASKDSGAAGDPTDTPAQRLAGLPRDERERLLLAMVRTHVAAVLGHSSDKGVDVAKGLLELGLDSLTAVELRNRLGAECGLKLPSTLVFDHPTVTAVASYLGQQLLRTVGTRPVLTDLERLEASLSAGSDLDTDTGQAVAARLEELLSRVRTAVGTASGAPATARPDSEALDLDSASLDEVLDFIDDEFGQS